MSPFPVTVDRRIAPPTAAPERSVPVSVHSAPRCPDACHAYQPGGSHRVPGSSHYGNVHVTRLWPLGCGREAMDQEIESLARKLHDICLGSRVHQIASTPQMLTHQGQTVS